MFTKKSGISWFYINKCMDHAGYRIIISKSLQGGPDKVCDRSLSTRLRCPEICDIGPILMLLRPSIWVAKDILMRSIGF